MNAPDPSVRPGESGRGQSIWTPDGVAPVDPPTQPLAVVTSGDRPGLSKTPWTFVDVFAGLGVVLLLGMLMAAVVVFTGVRAAGPALLLAALPVWIGLLGTAVWACQRHGAGNLISDLALRFRPIDLAIGLGAGLGLRLVIGVWAVVVSAITGQDPTSNLQSVLGDGLGSGVWLVLNMLAIAVIGPVVEEIFFRGLGLRSALASLWRRSGNPRFSAPRQRARFAMAATSLVFALLHLSEVGDATSALVLLPGLFLAGWVLAWLTTSNGRLGPAIATHVVFNGVAVVALLFLS